MNRPIRATLFRRPTRHPQALVLAVALALPATPGMALGFQRVDHGMRRLPVSSTGVNLHPFQDANDKPEAFSLFERGQISFNDTIVKMLRDRMTNPMLEVRGKPSPAFGLSTGGSSTDFRFYVGGVPICGFQLRAHELSDRSTFVLGDVPAVDLNEPLPSREWPDFDLAMGKATTELAAMTGAKTLELTSRGQCLYASGGTLMPVWNVTMTAEGLPYAILADAYDVLAIQAGFFDATTGSAKVYEFNKSTGDPKDFPLTDLTGDGTLASTYLRTVVPANYTQAKEPSEVFNYPSTDQRFDEAQAYTHAQEHFAFFKKLGFEWYGPSPLEIKIHVKPAGRSNNALFIPGSDTQGTLPSISIDDGDGIDLQYLVTDGDVVSHEFGHHVIYKTLQSTDGQSLVLHEGLADSFVFARTGDACLGESICPKASGVCILQGQCLRTGDNVIQYGKDEWVAWAGPKNRLGHLHGQLISGFVWDLRRPGKMAAGDVNALVFKAISYFREDSGLRDFLLALFTADRELFQSKNYDLIHAVAEARNMNEFMSDVTLGSIPQLEGSASALPSSSASSSSTTKKKDKGDDNPFRCGTISMGDSGASTLVLALMIAFPLLLAMRPAPVRVLTRTQRKRRNKNS